MSDCDVRVGRLALDGGSADVGRARRFVASTLKPAGIEADVLELAVLLVSEITTNAVLHAGTALVLTVSSTAAGGVLVELLDGNSQLPRPAMADANSVGGRGLGLVELVSDGYGVLPTAEGKLVWFALGDVGELVAARTIGWSPDEDSAAAAARVDVVLQDLPVDLYTVLRGHQEALIREYQLWLSETDATHDLPATELARARREAAQTSRARAALAAAVRSGVTTSAVPRTGDRPARAAVHVRLSASDAAACEHLPTVLDRAERLASQGHFLVRPALPELLWLRDWMCGQVVSQRRGQPPEPWVPGAFLDQPLSTPLAAVDLDWVQHTEHAVVLSDDSNRVLAISPSAERLLGWASGDLVGRRITLLVPPRLREAHVTGFMRHVHTGEARVIGQPIAVPCLRADGGETHVMMRLAAERLGERTLYRADFEPGGATG